MTFAHSSPRSLSIADRMLVYFAVPESFAVAGAGSDFAAAGAGAVSAAAVFSSFGAAPFLAAFAFLGFFWPFFGFAVATLVSSSPAGAAAGSAAFAAGAAFFATGAAAAGFALPS